MGGSRRRRRRGGNGQPSGAEAALRGDENRPGNGRGGQGRGRREARNRDGVAQRRAPTDGPARALVDEMCHVSPFSIFCALYLSITERDGYREQEQCEVARRFEMSDDELAAYLDEHHLTRQALAESGFDLSSARLDIEVAPEGISRMELARCLFAELKELVSG